jgi:hypothetical protein
VILRPVRWAVSLFVTFAVAWIVFMVPFGRFTLFQHARRIMATDEAQELGSEVGRARGRLTDEVVRQVGEAARADAGVPASPTERIRAR